MPTSLGEKGRSSGAQWAATAPLDLEVKIPYAHPWTPVDGAA